MVVILLMLIINQQHTTLLAEEVYATFTVHARKTANLAFSYSGIIKGYNVDIMSRVKKGDVLATLINDDLIATTNASKIALKYAKSDYKRHKNLLAKGLIDTALYDKFALQYESIKAKIALEETINAKTILRAPFDGVITKRMIEEGDVVSGQMLKTAFAIQSEHARILVVEFDQKYNADVKVGDAFIYKVDGDSSEHAGTVFRIYPTANANSRKVAIQVIARDLKVGLFGEGKLITSGKSGTPETKDMPSTNATVSPE